MYFDQFEPIIYPENTHLLHKGKYHCTTDLLFGLFKFDQRVNLFFIQHMQSSWNQSNKTGGQPYSEYFPLPNKLIFSDLAIWLHCRPSSEQSLLLFHTLFNVCYFFSFYGSCFIAPRCSKMEESQCGQMARLFCNFGHFHQLKSAQMAYKNFQTRFKSMPNTK